MACNTNTCAPFLCHPELGLPRRSHWRRRAEGSQDCRTRHRSLDKLGMTMAYVLENAEERQDSNA